MVHTTSRTQLTKFKNVTSWYGEIIKAVWNSHRGLQNLLKVLPVNLIQCFKMRKDGNLMAEETVSRILKPVNSRSWTEILSLLVTNKHDYNRMAFFFFRVAGKITVLLIKTVLNLTCIHMPFFVSDVPKFDSLVDINEPFTNMRRGAFIFVKKSKSG